jgi:phosphohistidine phosphatase SixA
MRSLLESPTMRAIQTQHKRVVANDNTCVRSTLYYSETCVRLLSAYELCGELTLLCLCHHPCHQHTHKMLERPRKEV